MHIPQNWKIQARAWIEDYQGRLAYAITVADDGGTTDAHVVIAAALPAGHDVADASLAIIDALRREPDLTNVGVDLATNHKPLANLLNEDRRIVGGHVSVLSPEQCPPGDELMALARRHSREAAENAGPVPLRGATDGSFGRRRDAISTLGQKSQAQESGGFGWILEDGQHGYGPLQSTSALHSELVAIERILNATPAARPLVVEVDSRPAIRAAKDALAGRPHPPEATRATAEVLTRLRRHSDRLVTFEWRKGHADNALNNAADALANLGRRSGAMYRDDALATMARSIVEQALSGAAAAPAALAS